MWLGSKQLCPSILRLKMIAAVLQTHFIFINKYIKGLLHPMDGQSLSRQGEHKLSLLSTKFFLLG